MPCQDNLTAPSGQEVSPERWVEIQTLLAQPFPAKDIEWRTLRVFEFNNEPLVDPAPYVTNRAIMDRLDDVVGAGNWTNQFVPITDNGSLIGYQCGLTIYGVTKWDAAPVTQVEAIKGGHSDSMKRTGVQWGMGRYLYKLDFNPFQIAISKSKKSGNDWEYAKTKAGVKFWWQHPPLPHWALPADEQPKPSRPTGQKYPPEEPTPADKIIAEAEAATSEDELQKIWDANSDYILNHSPKRREIVKRFTDLKAELSVTPGGAA